MIKALKKRDLHISPLTQKFEFSWLDLLIDYEYWNIILNMLKVKTKFGLQQLQHENRLNENQVGLKDPYTSEQDEPAKKEGRFKLSDKTENSWAMDPNMDRNSLAMDSDISR